MIFVGMAEVNWVKHISHKDRSYVSFICQLSNDYNFRLKIKLFFLGIPMKCLNNNSVGQILLINTVRLRGIFLEYSKTFYNKNPNG